MAENYTMYVKRIAEGDEVIAQALKLQELVKEISKDVPMMVTYEEFYNIVTQSLVEESEK